MSQDNTQNQINEINRKLDLVLEEINSQRLRRQEVDDLVSDLSIVGKDVFTTSVTALDKAGIELDYEALGALSIKLVRNIGTFNQMLETLESANDLLKDLTPIVNQVGLDSIALLAEYEQKGYLDFLKEFMNLTDKVVSHFTLDDVKALSANVVTMLELVKSVTQPEMLDSMGGAISVYKEMDFDKAPSYSMWKTFRAMSSPEMKKGMGFMITFMQQLIKNSQK